VSADLSSGDCTDKTDFVKAHVATGGTLGVLSNQFSHLLNSKGLSLMVDTVCASSAVMAVRAQTMTLLLLAVLMLGIEH